MTNHFLSEAIDTEFINENEFIRTSTQIDEMIKTPVKTITNGRYLWNNNFNVSSLTKIKSM